MQKRVAISQQVKGCQIVYFDLNFWIKLRQQSFQSNASDRELLDTVLSLVESKKVVFPISHITFLEIMKQGDIESRMSTIELVNYISKGLSMISNKDRVQEEFLAWFSNKTGRQCKDINETIWDSISMVIRKVMLSITDDTNLQKALIDEIYNGSLLDMNLDKVKQVEFKDDVIKLNKEIAEHKGENSTFKETFLSELSGILEENKDLLDKAFKRAYAEDNPTMPIPESSVGKDFCKMIYHGFRLDKITSELPVFHIFCTLYAWCRWINKPFKDGNDTFDFLHASFALPYCDYFFTDRRLAAGIKECNMDTLYECCVESKENKVLEILKAI